MYGETLECCCSAKTMRQLSTLGSTCAKCGKDGHKVEACTESALQCAFCRKPNSPSWHSDCPYRPKPFGSPSPVSPSPPHRFSAADTPLVNLVVGHWVGANKQVGKKARVVRKRAKKAEKEKDAELVKETLNELDVTTGSESKNPFNLCQPVVLQTPSHTSEPISTGFEPLFGHCDVV